MKRLLLQLDTSPRPSVFDRIVALDSGADEVLSYGGVTPDEVTDLVHGAIFTRGPNDLHDTAIFVGGDDMAAGERVLAAVQKVFFGPLRVSVMLDSNGANTTTVAALSRLEGVVGSLAGRRAVVTAGTGPVGIRAAGLLARAGADVVITSRRRVDPAALDALRARFGGRVESATVPEADAVAAVLDGAQLLLNAGAAGVTAVPREAWAGRAGLRVVADLNAVPPQGIEGVEVTDDGIERDGVVAFGALSVGGRKMKVHRAAIARLFEANDLVLDVEAIADIGAALFAPAS